MKSLGHRVMLVTLAATLLATPALCADPAPPAPIDAQMAPGLPVRASKPLVLAPESQSSGIGWKFFASVLVLGGAFLFWKRRSANVTSSSIRTDRPLKILRRVGVGVRSELLIVQAEGKRLLLGVTPHAIQSLSVLADEEEYEAPAEDSSTIGDRLARMVQGAENGVRSRLTRGHATEAAPGARARLRMIQTHESDTEDEAEPILLTSRHRKLAQESAESFSADARNLKPAGQQDRSVEGQARGLSALRDPR